MHQAVVKGRFDREPISRGRNQREGEATRLVRHEVVHREVGMAQVHTHTRHRSCAIDAEHHASNLTVALEHHLVVVDLPLVDQLAAHGLVAVEGIANRQDIGTHQDVGNLESPLFVGVDQVLVLVQDHDPTPHGRGAVEDL